MIIYPAIDLRQDHCVRLYQGNYQLKTTYSDNPFHIAAHFVAEGATWLHLIDLDAAKDPAFHQRALITAIINEVQVKVQTGGGIRTFSQIEALLVAGATRIIIGSMAIKDPKEVAKWFQYFGGDRLVLALDVMINDNSIPIVTIDAWQKESSQTLYDVIDFYLPYGLIHLLSTNVRLDGTLKGPDFFLYDNLIMRYPQFLIQASGGIHHVKDILQLREKKLQGAIIGRALYEKKFSLSQVLSC